MPRGRQPTTKMVMGEKCSCNPVWMILSAIIMAIGIFLIVQGFTIQLSAGGSWDTSMMAWVLGYYFVGIILFGVGKIMKAKGCCAAHGRM